MNLSRLISSFTLSLIFIFLIANSLSIEALSLLSKPMVICGQGYHPISKSNLTCAKCPVGFYCADGKEAYPCPAMTYSQGKATTCTPCTTRVSEDRVNCLLEGFDSQATELEHYTTSLFIEPGQDNFMFRSQRYIGNTFANQSLIITENSQKTPLTIYVSTKTSTPNRSNYEYVFSGVNPTISFKAPSEYYVVYLNIVTQNKHVHPNISIKTGWS